ncbi:Alpha/beta hydrolase family protein [Massilia sp. PDC64]|nr:alpha/beta fold hydrolase [Massilia sp. PDC64]SDD74203.1 Alpha/beta hydrolase family protein [Massilia sp. PDC64]
MATYVLVPGGWHGGWAFDAVARRLEDAGHEVVALTLSGLDGGPAAGVNLDRHIADVVAAIETATGPVVLAAHSYGGMVIAGAADRAPSRVAALVFVDAYVPDDGDSVWSLTIPRYHDFFIAGAAADGLTCAPPPHLDARCRPHPLATFVQAIRLTGAWRRVGTKIHVAATGWEGNPFVELNERLRADPAWRTHHIDCAHDVPRLAPAALADILLDAAPLRQGDHDADT